MKTESRLFKMLRMDARTLIWWRSRRHRIDVDPSYQRKGRRWSISDKQYLIDSILNGFDIPKFYVVDFTWGDSPLNEKNSEYAVIDGKQRFESVFEFFDDKFPLAANFRLLNQPTLPLGGLKYSVLKTEYPEVAELFDNFNPDVMTVIASKKEYIEELFVRLNRSKPLSGAEIRNAITGEVSEIIRSIRGHEFFTSNVRFNTNKGQDLNCAAKLLMFEVTGALQETKKTQLDKFVKEAPDNTTLKKSVETLFSTLENMSEVFQFKDALLGSEGQIPIYYWLCRNSSAEAVPYFRDFLETFMASLDNQVKRGALLTEGEKADFKIASRSINDRTSHSLRYDILKKAFDKWLSLNL